MRPLPLKVARRMPAAGAMSVLAMQQIDFTGKKYCSTDSEM
jgi:hypothetical protein